MAGSLIYLGTHAITHGKLDVAKQASREMGAFLEANHPRMLHFGIYIDDDAHQMTVIQVHPDEDSLVLHLSLDPPVRISCRHDPNMKRAL